MAEIIPNYLIPDLIEQEGMQVWLCSYGGSGTNMLADYLESKGFVIKTPSWHKLLCHYSMPVSLRSNIRAIYLFSDPILAFMSMIHRGQGFYDVNQRKMNNNTDIPISDETLIKSIINQYKNWTRGTMCNFPILALKYERLFDEGKEAVSSFLGIDTADFPKRVNRSSKESDLGHRRLALQPFIEAIELIRSSPGVRQIG